MESLLFVALAPLAALLMLVVGLIAWRRRDAPGGWALVAFSVAEAGWLTCDALSVLAASPDTTVRLAQATFVWSPLLGVAWLAFVLGYTDRLTRAARVAVGALGAWCLAYGGLALTNDAHRLVWSAWEVVPDGPLLGVTYTLGPLAWVQTGLMWTAVTVSLGVLLWVYARADARSRDLSRWIVIGALVPLGVNVLYLLGIGPVTKDFTPIVMSVSSGAFALGLIRYQFLDLQPIARAALVDDLREGMLVLDAQGRVADLNPALLRALGDGAAELGRPLEETAPDLARAIDASLTEPVHLGARHYDLRVSPLTDRSGRTTGRLVLLHDVTRQREERAALHRANADLYDANVELQARNDELDAFAHTVAHDLKNSVQGVIGWAEVLRDEGPELTTGEHHELADSVVRAAQKMGTVVHELLLLAGVRRAAVNLQPMAMGAIVDEALARLRQAGTEVVEPAARPERWPVAVGHAPWVEEVWVNYLSNAAKYGGPTVTLGADVPASGHARFWVHDDGPGLSPEAQAGLFAAFSRVGTTEVEGHGLGLSIVRRIAERLGGTCGVESRPGEGTRFWFALPHAKAPVGSDAFAMA
ncbi:sensor histidine kinase [Rubrivirga marina]|uniref:histidine kinase n=1 Tax=Rubrivirga marina TaxID=1196024 RepID=A0A271IZN1_9BACT|nr:histidine kinase N-terminal 7TM domain-containing protein [Rubrivirga marina]PAP76448.1 hypothetical protein BSZ37_08335 [Rubrivirga marina]